MNSISFESVDSLFVCIQSAAVVSVVEPGKLAECAKLLKPPPCSKPTATHRQHLKNATPPRSFLDLNLAALGLHVVGSMYTIN